MAEPALPSIRRLVGDDLPAYKALRDAVLGAHPDAFTSDADSEAAKPASAHRARLGTPPLNDGRFTLGAWRGAQLLGAVTCDRDPRAKAQHTGHVAGMMVWPAAQRGGIGRALLAACIDEAQRAPGLELLTLSVTSSNARAVALYRRAGFIRYGNLPRAVKIEGVYHDKDLMVLQLRSASR